MNFALPERDTRECMGQTPEMLFKGPLYADIVYMSPQKFLERADRTFSSRSPAFNRNSVRHIIAGLRKGECVAPLQLWPLRTRPWGMRHEGRHRAWLAMRLGIEEVPVYIWRIT